MRALRVVSDDEIPQPAMVFESNEMTDLSVLDDGHANIFKIALARLLATELAELTFAEIVDGLPTLASFYDFHLSYNKTDHPVYALNHTELCAGVLEKTRQIRDTFDPMTLAFKTEVYICFERQKLQQLPWAFLTYIHVSSFWLSNARHATRNGLS